MNDTQINSNGHLVGIPVISPILHCLSIPVVIFLRFKFGYLYLGPKSIFFPTILLGAVSSLLAWRYSWSQEMFRGLIGFYLISSILYFAHFIFAYASQWARSAEHDRCSGTSYLLAGFPEKKRGDLEGWAHCLFEPLLLALAGWAAGGLVGTFLLVGAASLFLKEWINAWKKRRNDKIDADMVLDARERGTPHLPETTRPFGSAGRVDEEDIERIYEDDDDEP